MNRNGTTRRVASRLAVGTHCATRAAFLLALAFVQSVPAQSRPTTAPRFEVVLDAAVSEKPYTGRVYIMTNQRGDPLRGPQWFGTQPFFAQDVENWKPGETLVFDAQKCLGFHGPLAELPAGMYRAAAVIDLNGWSHEVVAAPGNGHSAVVEFTNDPEAPPTVQLEISEKYAEPELKDTDTLKYVRLKSDLLSAFYGHDVFMQAAIALPPAYGEAPQRRFPTMYTIPGFGGTISQAKWYLRGDRFSRGNLDIVQVFLDPDCPTGHHVFADSANNGPRGKALVEELIPHLEKEFRLIADPDARFLTGHSSGGWSSLWLQVAYPDFFGGTWSTSPDPVDFSAFQLVNIYDPTDNMYAERDGSPRALSRGVRGQALLTRTFCQMETVLGRGGQMQSFEAVFSPRALDGRPRPLWGRASGALDPVTAEAWKKYDIRLILESQWPMLGPKLQGKLHLFCGDEDTFYLERAFFKLRDTLKTLGSDAYVEVVPGASHMLPGSVQRKIAEQVAEQFRSHYAMRHGP